MLFVFLVGTDGLIKNCRYIYYVFKNQSTDLEQNKMAGFIQITKNVTIKEYIG